MPQHTQEHGKSSVTSRWVILGHVSRTAVKQLCLLSSAGYNRGSAHGDLATEFRLTQLDPAPDLECESPVAGTLLLHSQQNGSTAPGPSRIWSVPSWVPAPSGAAVGSRCLQSYGRKAARALAGHFAGSPDIHAPVLCQTPWAASGTYEQPACAALSSPDWYSRV